MEQLVARQAHNLEVIRSSRVSATHESVELHKVQHFFLFPTHFLFSTPRSSAPSPRRKKNGTATHSFPTPTIFPFPTANPGGIVRASTKLFRPCSTQAHASAIIGIRRNHRCFSHFTIPSRNRRSTPARTECKPKSSERTSAGESQKSAAASSAARTTASSFRRHRKKQSAVCTSNPE